MLFPESISRMQEILHAQPGGRVGLELVRVRRVPDDPQAARHRTGLIVAAAVFSHWILDLIVHRADMALYDSVFKMGFGMWNYRIPAFMLEMAVLFGSAAMDGKTVARKGKVIIYVALLAVLQFFATFVLPPPASDRGEAVTALFFYFLLATIAWWVERGQVKTKSAAGAA